MRWKRWGIAFDERYLYVRSGLVGQTIRCFELFKLQQVSLRYSLFMQRNEVTNIDFVLASGAITIPFMPMQEAEFLAQKTLDTAQKTHKSWM